MRTVTILLAAMAVLAWAGPANAGGVLYETGFEAPTFTEGVSIDGIDGWDLNTGIYPNDGPVTAETTGCISGTMSMYSMASAGASPPSGKVHINVVYNNPTDLVVSTQCKIKMATNTDHTILYTLAGSGSQWKRLTSVYFQTDGYVTANNGGTNQALKDGAGNDMTYSAGTVYGVRVVTDTVTSKYDIYIDSGSGYVLAGDKFDFREGSTTAMVQLFYTLTYDNPLIMDDVSIVGLVQGDANFDGTVDDSDLNLMLTGWSTGATPGTTWPEGDFNDDGVVNDSDLNLLLTNWTYPPAGSVPEPATIGLLAFGAIALVRRRRRA